MAPACMRRFARAASLANFILKDARGQLLLAGVLLAGVLLAAVPVEPASTHSRFFRRRFRRRFAVAGACFGLGLAGLDSVPRAVLPRALAAVLAASHPA